MTCFWVTSSAQTPSPGMPMYSTMANGPVDHINLANLGISLEIPIRSRATTFPLSVSLYQQSYYYLTGNATQGGYWTYYNHPFQLQPSPNASTGVGATPSAS